MTGSLSMGLSENHRLRPEWIGFVPGVLYKHGSTTFILAAFVYRGGEALQGPFNETKPNIPAPLAFPRSAKVCHLHKKTGPAITGGAEAVCT
jgi:hypothetical protein